jgi:hypothetical protein
VKDCKSFTASGFASFLHPFKSIILDKRVAYRTTLNILQKVSGCVGIATAGDPLKRVNVAKMVLYGE